GGRPRLVVAEETYCRETATLAVHEREVLLAQQASERLRQGHRLEVGGHLARLVHLASNFGAALPREFLEDLGVRHASQADSERIVAIAKERCRRLVGRPGLAPGRRRLQHHRG